MAINRLGFGAMRLTGSGVFHDGVPSDRGRAIAVLRRAIELGVNHIDTAAFYFSRLRSSNELINTALAPYPESLVIATKVGPVRDPSGDWQALARPDQLRGQVEENLRQLGRDHLDLVNLRVHGLDSVADHFAALAELRQAGLIRHLGLSNVRRAARRAGASDRSRSCACRTSTPSTRAGLMTICSRRAGPQGIAFVPFFAIAGDAREAGGVTGHDAVTAVAQARGATPAQIRLAWTLSRGRHVLAIPGTSDVAHLEENIAAGAIKLTTEELAQLG
jgi:aryl-alcohol dehydrogenase-like predicted oxidoreductase